MYAIKRYFLSGRTLKFSYHFVKIQNCKNLIFEAEYRNRICL